MRHRVGKVAQTLRKSDSIEINSYSLFARIATILPVMPNLELVTRDALSSLYREYHGWLYGWLRGKLGNACDAADIAQDTFVRVIAGRAVEQIREPKDYLATIARGLMTDRFRRRAIEQAYLDELAARPEACAISPETRALILETLVAIDRLLDELGSRTRQIFLMAQLEGKGYAEIGETLGVSVTTVKKHLVRALTQCLVLASD